MVAALRACAALCLLVAPVSAASLRGEGTRLRRKGEKTGYIMPKGEIVCMEGPMDYMEKVLVQLRASPMMTGWQPETTRVIEGECRDRGYWSASAEKCFPKATLWSDRKPEHMSLASKMDKMFIDEWQQKYNKGAFNVISGMLRVCLK
eukprot:CAMPEP_0197893968 /NCGR_PEP_ID=MMETSP1439-20131203/33962_1 /TAXON_ID=66791 /ORGANISM="Gonyaulax spinifera, Strain CCMP409" /LENGTH=147 /DNA_ID=CAMNT_0043514275 /DNA_START=55 /DNA_END=498 /DNA_ORIENTATION=+